MLFDDIYREIGEFGPYQILMYCLLGLVGIPAGWQNMAITFIGADMDSWCKVDGLQNFTMDQQRKIAIPYENGRHYSRCEYYALNLSTFTSNDLAHWNRSGYNYNATPVTKCSQHLYDQTTFISSVVSQWDLSCERAALGPLIQTIYMTGFLIGCVVFGQISDKIGRRRTLLMAILLQITFALAATFSPYYVLYCTLRFFVGMGTAGSFTTMFVLSMEIIGAKYRMATGVLVQAWFAIGLMTYPWMSYVIRDHVKLQLVAACCPIVLLLLFFVAPESPRWYVTHGHDKEAEEMIRKMALMNNRECPEFLYLSDNRESDEKATGSIVHLVSGRNIRKISLLMMFCWFVTSLGYYGLSLGVDLLHGSLFVNSCLSGAVELPAYVIAIFSLTKIGRRWPTIISFILVALFCFLCVPFFQKTDYDTILTVFLMMGKCFSAGVFGILYVYSAELFPTVVRSVGVGCCSMSARISGLLQPQVALAKVVWEPLPFIIYGGTSLFAGLASFFFPETLGKELPETLEDIEQFGRKRRSTVTSILNTHFVSAEKQNGKVNIGYTLTDAPDPCNTEGIHM